VELDDKICYCFHVSKRKILNHIRIHKPRVASQISDCAGAGTGCGWCIPFLRQYFSDSRADVTEGPESESLSPEEYARQRGEYIRAGKGTPPAGATPAPQID